jgi:hypothetical protein
MVIGSRNWAAFTCRHSALEFIDSAAWWQVKAEEFAIFLIIGSW